MYANASENVPICRLCGHKMELWRNHDEIGQCMTEVYWWCTGCGKEALIPPENPDKFPILVGTERNRDDG